LKTESLNLNLLQEQFAELDKQKNIMIIEVEALHTDFNARLGLLDSEINTVSLPDRFRLYIEPAMSDIQKNRDSSRRNASVGSRDRRTARPDF
jgi:Na+-transporting NADH:ubiquinone oxidoreductase subunit NqrC